MLKNTADLRTLLWMLVFAPGLVAVQYANPQLLPYLSWLSFYFAISAGVIAHNHLHAPVFKQSALNELFGGWISIFYGYPTFGWIPTHNLNHHKFVNKPGDATITWRFTNKHNYLVAASYFFVSSYYQSGPIKEFLKKTKEKRPVYFRQIVLQYIGLYGTQAVMLGLGMYLYGVWPGITLWLFTLGLPALVSLWTIMTFNYEQHVHTDPWSNYDHSRNFTGRLLNFLLFNNGLHTAHHDSATLHWSELPAAHEKIAAKIHPQLKQRSLWWYWCKQYLLAPVFPRLGSVQLGRAPYQPPEGELDIATAPVGVGRAGTNAARV